MGRWLYGRRPLDRQPLLNEAVEINRDTNLAHGLAALVYPGLDAVDLVSPIGQPTTNSALYIGGPRGVGRYLETANSGSIVLPPSAIAEKMYGTAGLTVVASVRTLSPAADYSAVRIFDCGWGWNKNFFFGCWHTSSTGTLYLNAGGDGQGSTWEPNLGSTLGLARDKIIGWSVQSGITNGDGAYLNGQRKASQTRTLNLTSEKANWTAGLFRLRDQASSSPYWVIDWVAVWNRALDDGEHAALATNPHQLLVVPSGRRIYIPSAAGGGETVTPDVGNLTLTGYAPTITVTAHQTVSPDKASLTLTGYAPSISVSTGADVTVNPDVGQLTITGYAPTISSTEHQVVEPEKAALTLTGYAPTISRTENQTVSPAVGQLTLTGYAPSIGQGITINPTTGALVLTGYAPTISVTGNAWINADTGQLEITGYEPTISVSGAKPATSPGGAGKKRAARFLGASFYDEPTEFRVLIQEETPQGIQYREISWEADASWDQTQQAIEAVLGELGNLETTLERSTLLRKKLKRLKKKRNQKIILLSIE